MDKEKVVIIIPTYNEAAVIEETVRQVFAATTDILNFDINILVFDSSSTDATQDIIISLQAEYKNLYLQKEVQKTGLGSAYLQAMHYGMTELGADIVFEFDADLSHQPKYIGPMLEKLNDHDVVVGSRYVQGGSIPQKWSFHRKLLSKVGNKIARIMLTLKYRDFTSGFRASRRNILTKALPINNFISNHYAYKLELMWSLHKNKVRMYEYPIEFVDREKGQSKLPANSISDSLWVLVVLRYRELKPYVTMCTVGCLGLLIQCIFYNVFRLHLSPFNSVQLATMFAMMNNFIFNNRFTFAYRKMSYDFPTLKKFLWFIGCSIGMIKFQSYWLAIGINTFGPGFFNENVLLFIGIILGSFFNYLIYSRIIWKIKPQTT